MLCYVGKATKIFFFLIAFLAVLGLFLGLGLLRHGTARKAGSVPCQGGGGNGPCLPITSNPATAAAIPPPFPMGTTETGVPPPPPAAEAVPVPVPPTAANEGPPPPVDGPTDPVPPVYSTVDAPPPMDALQSPVPPTGTVAAPPHAVAPGLISDDSNISPSQG